MPRRRKYTQNHPPLEPFAVSYDDGGKLPATKIIDTPEAALEEFARQLQSGADLSPRLRTWMVGAIKRTLKGGGNTLEIELGLRARRGRPRKKTTRPELALGGAILAKREQGATWESIAEQLDMEPDAARALYARVHPDVVEDIASKLGKRLARRGRGQIRPK